MDYVTADSKLQGRNAMRRKIGNNTYLERRESGDIAVRLHNTDIVTLHRDGSFTLNSGGWHTVTTKARINEFAPKGYISQQGGVWYFYNSISDQTEPVIFKDGMRISVIGRIEGAAPLSERTKAAKLRKRINTYTKAYVTALRNGKVISSGGDCLYCSARTVGTEATLGETIKDTEHLLSHFKEKYYVPSLLRRAVEVFPVSIIVKDGIYHAFLGRPEQAFPATWEYAERSLRRYLLRQFGQA